jgi:flagellar hook assembly protein FlgD
MRGRLVRTLLDGSRVFGAGTYSVVWDGRDDSGVQVSSGIYLYRMTAGEHQSIKRMLLMK